MGVGGVSHQRSLAIELRGRHSLEWPTEYINAAERSGNDVSPSGKLNLRPCGPCEHKLLVAGKVIWIMRPCLPSTELAFKKSNSGGTFFYIINRTIGMWNHLWFWGRWMDLMLKHCFPLRKTLLSILSKIDFCDMGLCCQGLSRLNQTDRQPIRRFPVQTFGPIWCQRSEWTRIPIIHLRSATDLVHVRVASEVVTWHGGLRTPQSFGSHWCQDSECVETADPTGRLLI